MTDAEIDAYALEVLRDILDGQMNYPEVINDREKISIALKRVRDECQNLSLPSREKQKEAAEEYAMGGDFSNNNDEAADAWAAFIDGADWLRANMKQQAKGEPHE
jgi:hypothetical protein